MSPGRPALGSDEHRVDSDRIPSEARAAFLLRLRERGVRDLAVLRAMEAVSRACFVSPLYAGLAARDMALPIACGQTVPEPLFVARMMAGSMLRKDMRVLVIGVGSGYATAVLSHLVRHVVAVDRFKTLASEAEARLGSLAIENVEVAWADGLQVRVGEPFDRILLFAVADPLPESLWPHLAKDGAIVHARRMTDGQGDVPARQVLIRTSLYTDGLSRDAVICPARLSPLLPGLSEVL